MFVYLRLFMQAFVPVAISVILYCLQRKGCFATLSLRAQQCLIGLIFGGAAIIGTEWGVDVGGAIANVRDAAPLCAGLIFGGPAGIIAGIIGGLERWLCVYWNGGVYSRFACSLSTALAGLYAAVLRRYMFDNKRPTWGFGLATGIVMEVLHMIILFLTHITDSSQAFAVVKICTIPMVACNGFAVMISLILISLLSQGRHADNKHRYTRISQKVQSWLLLCVVCAYLVTTSFIYALQTFSAQRNTESLLSLNITDVQSEILAASDRNMLAVTREVRNSIIATPNTQLVVIATKKGVSEINLVDENGIVTASTELSYIGYDMASGEQSAEFLVLNEGTTEFVQNYRPTSIDRSISRKYAGVSLPFGGFVQVGYDTALFQRDIDNQVRNITNNRHIGETGYMIVADGHGQIVSDRSDHTGGTLKDIGIISLGASDEGAIHHSVINGEDSCWYYAMTEGYYLIAVLPAAEAYATRDANVYVNSYMEVIVFAALFALIYFLIKRLVVDNIRSVNASLARIIGGDLNVTVDVHTSEEFASLSDDINSTVSTLRHYIDEAASRIDKELAFAKSIQHSALPSMFPAYPNNPEFDIFASMDTAKEVGGDFYDFYMVDPTHLAFLIADVSGKGIPAAMFMMTAKTMLKNFAESGMSVDDVFTHANAKLCEGNDADMFVTAWMGILDIESGHITFANAGHNPPLVYRKGEGYTYLKSKVGLVLAGMDGMRYKIQELDLHPGDKIFLYTDGITEATSAATELYGEERLLAYLNANTTLTPEQTLKGTKVNVDTFVGEAEQFDDMTMLMVAYNGKDGGDMEERVFPATDAALNDVNAFVEAALDEAGVSMKVSMQIMVALEEIFVNIAHYAYGDDAGEARVALSLQDGKCTLRFTDSGIPFNPLERDDPDVTLAAQDRSVGGLGIYMVKKTMDSVTYAYKNGQNVLTLVKSI